LATFAISSCIVTVFHTHAHPNNQTFHHFNIGEIKSITLIHVSNISALFVSSSNEGAGLCIGRLATHLISGLLSIAFHNTFVILPKTSGPTGTDIGAHELTTSSHLFSPSVVSIAIHFTTQSSNCCNTSITTVFHSLFLDLVSNAS
jgi:hypothetical protein